MSVRTGIKQVKVERPRPLKIGGGTQPQVGVDDLVVVVDSVRRTLSGGGGGESPGASFDVVSQLQTLSANLKLSGSQLESSHKDLMDKLNHSLMLACKQEVWPLVSRVLMLELIEMRSMNWSPTDNVVNYYKQKLAQIEANQPPPQSRTAPVQSSNSKTEEFNPFKSSFTSNQNSLNNNNTNITPNNNYELSKDEVKVEKIVESDPKKFSLSLKVRDEEIVVTGSSVELVKTAKIVLNEFFNICSPESSPGGRGDEVLGAEALVNREEDSDDMQDPGIELVQPKISYKKDELLAMAKSPYCQQLPDQWPNIVKELPGVVRRQERAGPTSKLILREMEGLRKQEEAKNV